MKLPPTRCDGRFRSEVLWIIFNGFFLLFFSVSAAWYKSLYYGDAVMACEKSPISSIFHFIFFGRGWYLKKWFKSSTAPATGDLFPQPTHTHTACDMLLFSHNSKTVTGSGRDWTSLAILEAIFYQRVHDLVVWLNPSIIHPQLELQTAENLFYYAPSPNLSRETLLFTISPRQYPATAMATVQMWNFGWKCLPSFLERRLLPLCCC